MEFQAEIVETKQSKTVSNLDNNYTIKFRTNNPLILDLGKLPPQTIVSLKVDIAERIHEYGEDKIQKVKLSNTDLRND